MKNISSIVNDSEKSSNVLESNVSEATRNNNEVMKMISNTTQMLGELTSSFSEVVEKTAMINDIVFQTKLLSFNASVEAARAGEHGKGFSVVAEEIGNLAAMSGDSAISIQKTLEKN